MLSQYIGGIPADDYRYDSTGPLYKEFLRQPYWWPAFEIDLSFLTKSIQEQMHRNIQENREQ